MFLLSIIFNKCRFYFWKVILVIIKMFSLRFVFVKLKWYANYIYSTLLIIKSSTVVPWWPYKLQLKYLIHLSIFLYRGTQNQIPKVTLFFIIIKNSCTSKTGENIDFRFIIAFLWKHQDRRVLNRSPKQ